MTMDDETFLELTTSEFEAYLTLPVCGCGIPNEVVAVYHRVLAVTPRGYRIDEPAPYWPSHEERVAACPNELLRYTVAYVLDHIGATEHGGGVGGAWRTEKGEVLLSVLDRWAESDYEAIPVGAEIT